MNVIARLEFELAYFKTIVQRINHYNTETPSFNVMSIFSLQYIFSYFCTNDLYTIKLLYVFK